MKKQQTISENYLEKIPKVNPALSWRCEDGQVIIEKENTGIANRIAQKLIRKPKVTQIHLDKMGNFVWPLIDGKRTITEIGTEVDLHFGKSAHPLWERLAQYFKILENYGFVTTE